MDKKIKCPICEGCGFIEKPKIYEVNASHAKRLMAYTLRENGYSLRQICRLVGWSSPRSALLAIRAMEKNNG